MKAILVAICTVLSASPVLALDLAKGFESYHVALYQPDDVLQARVGVVAALTNYIEQLRGICTEYFATTTTPETLHIVVAVRPGKRARVWLVSSTRREPEAQREPLRKQLEAIPPCEVHGGPIAFAISAKLAGGDGQIPKEDRTPIPKEWQDAVTATGREGGPVPDGVFDLIWPDTQ
jgi:hypothetical protein